MPGDPVLTEALSISAPAPEPEPEMLGRGERERPPTRYRSEVTKLRFGQKTHHIRVGFYADGRVCDVFISASKTGSDIRAILDVLAITASMYLQMGGSSLELAAKLRHSRFEPSGPVENPEDSIGIETVSSVADALAQLLESYG